MHTASLALPLQSAYTTAQGWNQLISFNCHLSVLCVSTFLVRILDYTGNCLLQVANELVHRALSARVFGTSRRGSVATDRNGTRSGGAAPVEGVRRRHGIRQSRVRPLHNTHTRHPVRHAVYMPWEYHPGSNRTSVWIQRPRLESPVCP